MNKVGNIAKNTSYLTLALIIQKVISFTYFTLLARHIGPAMLGKYYLAISFTTIFAIVIDLGFANVLTREVAKEAKKAAAWLANILGMKIGLSLLALVAVVISINALGYDGLTRQLVYISCVSMVLDSFTAIFFAVSRGFHNLKYESISSVIFQVIVLVVGYGALLLGGGLIPAMAALALASVFNFLYSLGIVKKYWSLSLKPAFDRALSLEIISLSWPFALYAVSQRLYTYFDSVILSLLAGDEQVGLYQVAFKIIFALQFLPSAFTASLYPAMSAYWQENREQLAVSFERAMNYLIIISMPIIVGALVLADKLVLLFKDAYGGAVLPLQISIISLFFIFINFPIGSLLNASNEQRKNTRNMVIVTVVSVIMNFLLIPELKAVGASITVLSTNALMTVLGLYYVRQKIVYKASKNLLVLYKVAAASFLMGFIIWGARNYLDVFSSTILGAVLYFLFLFLLGGFKKEDILSIAASFRLSKKETEA